MSTPSLLVCACAVPLFFASSCGYHVGTRHSLIAGVKIRRLAIPLVLNRSKTPQVEAALTRALRVVFRRSGSLRVTETAVATAVLRCVVLEVSTVGISTPTTPDGRLAIVQYRVNLAASFRLLSRRSGEPIWFADKIVASSEYLASSSPAVTEANKRWALEVASVRLAELAFAKITDAF